jgi:flagellar biosynthesis protein
MPPKIPKSVKRTKAKQKLAIALNHDDRGAVPRVTATGRGKLAEKMLALAFAHGVKVREDKDLAEVLGALEVDWEIPVEVFAAVAEILSYVYRANAASPPTPERDP